jgi:hypothetical protein
MKKTWYFLAAILLAFFVGSCANNKKTVQETTPPPPEDIHTAFESVYNTYRSELILDGAETYTVVKGDTLSAITRRHYGAGNGYFFPLIMLASSDVVLDPDLLEPGMVLTIPDLQRNLNDAAAREKVKSFLSDIAGVYERKEALVTQKRLIELANSL